MLIMPSTDDLRQHVHEVDRIWKRYAQERNYQGLISTKRTNAESCIRNLEIYSHIAKFSLSIADCTQVVGFAEFYNMQRA